jgi:hypothetical protein
MSVAIIGLVGVVVGALITGVANWLIQDSQSKSQSAAAAKAAARLTYDDFLHYQSTIVRALSRNHHDLAGSGVASWWDESEVLPRQTSADDQKRLLSALDDEPSQDVAAAQGWMEYLLNRSKTTSATTNDLTVMQDTFCRLDLGREHLSGPISGRHYTSFKDGAVLDSLPYPDTLEELGISDQQCAHRHAVNYGREERPPPGAPEPGPGIQPADNMLGSRDPLFTDEPAADDP